MLYIQKASVVVFKEARSAEGPKHFDFLKWSEGGRRPTERSVMEFSALVIWGGAQKGHGAARLATTQAAGSGTESARFLCYVRALARTTFEMANWLNKRVCGGFQRGAKRRGTTAF